MCKKDTFMTCLNVDGVSYLIFDVESYSIFLGLGCKLILLSSYLFLFGWLMVVHFLNPIGVGIPDKEFFGLFLYTTTQINVFVAMHTKVYNPILKNVVVVEV